MVGVILNMEWSIVGNLKAPKIPGLQCYWCQLGAATRVPSPWDTLQARPWVARSPTSLSAHGPRRKVPASRLSSVGTLQRLVAPNGKSISTRYPQIYQFKEIRLSHARRCSNLYARALLAAPGWLTASETLGFDQSAQHFV